MQHPPGDARLHFADYLRAGAMLSVIFDHAMISFTSTGGWPVHDRQTSRVFDVLVLLEHVFAMPLYFAMSGLFSHLLCDKRGVSGFLVQRVKRILVPLLVAMITIIPLVRAVGIYGRLREIPPDARPSAMSAIAAHFTSGEFFRRTNAGHLWFLFDLLWISVVAAAVAATVGPTAMKPLDRTLKRFAGAWWFPLALSFLTLPFLWPMKTLSADHASDIFNPARIVVYHGLFFAFGWRLYRQADVIAGFGRRAVTFLAVGLLVCFPAYTWVLLRSPAAGGLLRVLTLLLYGLTVWLLVLGLVGWFAVRHNRPNAAARYLADSSYWIYLVHYPLIGLAQVLVAHSGLPAGVKYFGILAVCLPLLFLSYQTLVRYTPIGRWLNGPRRRATRAEPQTPAVL